MKSRGIFAMVVSSLLLALTPLAADQGIQRGIDVFATKGDGKTYYDFSQNPIPAGFFCKASKMFDGRVAFKGLPLATEVPGQLWGADTIIERLDDAAFDTKGAATTRLQFRALSLVSIAPIKTACGAFHVYVSLNGKQRVTTMSISRTQEDGGSFSAPLAVDVRMRFIPVKPARGKAARKLEMTGSFTFPPTPVAWSVRNDLTKGLRSVNVDTDGDQNPDTLLPSPSSFAPGWEPGQSRPALTKGNIGPCPCEPTCHATEGEWHCTYPTYQCYEVICP